MTALIALGLVTVLTLGPRALVAPAREEFMRAVDAAAVPLIGWTAYGDAERILNTLLFVPLGAAVALLLRPRAWPVGVLAGFALSAAVEHAQAGIPGRVPDAADVLWNTLGAAIGVAAVTVVRLAVRSVRSLRGAIRARAGRHRGEG